MLKRIERLYFGRFLPGCQLNGNTVRDGDAKVVAGSQPFPNHYKIMSGLSREEMEAADESTPLLRKAQIHLKRFVMGSTVTVLLMCAVVGLAFVAGTLYFAVLFAIIIFAGN